MKPNWNTPRTKEGLQIPESYLKKDADTQNRREVTFLLQEAAFAEHIPIYCVIDMEQLSEGEQNLFLCDDFSCRAAILLGFPVKETHLFMEQQIPEIDGSRTETMAELKVKNYLLNYSDILRKFVKKIKIRRAAVRRHRPASRSRMRGRWARCRCRMQEQERSHRC